MRTDRLVTLLLVVGVVILVVLPGSTGSPRPAHAPASALTPPAEVEFLSSSAGRLLLLAVGVGLTAFWMVVGWRAMRAHETLAAGVARLAGNAPAPGRENPPAE